MELAAAKTPFVYFPLRRHFEQNLHVRHRLERYGAGRADGPRHGDARDASPPRSPRRWPTAPRGAEVERDGAARAAGLIAELL